MAAAEEAEKQQRRAHVTVPAPEEQEQHRGQQEELCGQQRLLLLRSSEGEPSMSGHCHHVCPQLTGSALKLRQVEVQQVELLVEFLK